MKKLLLFCALSVFGISTMNAQQATPVAQQASEMQRDTKIEVKDLPKSVKDNIDGNIEDKAAKVMAAHKKSKDGKEYYEVTFQKDDKSRYMKKYDDKGKMLERKSVDMPAATRTAKVAEKAESKISMRDVPQPIKKNIDENVEDKAAKLTEAHKKSKDGKTYYEVYFQKKDKSRYMKKYDEQGKVLEKKEVEMR